MTRTELDLLKEQLNKFKRQLFAVSNEVTGHQQKDMFFNARPNDSQHRPSRR